MKRKRDYLLRYIGLGAIFIIVSLIFTARLINIQIAGQDYYSVSSYTDTTSRTVKIQAQRGEIFDRNGTPLVTNEYKYNIQLDAGSLSNANEERNKVILSILKNAADCGEEDTFTLPDSPFTPAEGDSESISFNTSYMDSVYGKRLKKLLTELGCKDDVSAADAKKALLKRYGMINEEGDLVYGSDSEPLFTIRVDMDNRNFSTVEPYTILNDVSVILITRLKETSLRGIEAVTQVNRIYNIPGYASHILGRVGKIQSESKDYYTSQGYALDAIVGVSGAEKSFEQYLRGVDGELTIVEDEYGNVVDQYVSREPEAGYNVYLTIDIKMQIEAEKALAANIDYIVEKAIADTKEEQDGEDANAGALVALDIDTGEVLTLASHPTYNLVTFSEDYKTLSSDPLSPLFNRALEGTYPPGSTFKIGIAAAALMEKIITPNTLIRDPGVYTFYDDYQPRCWIYNAYRTTHGTINVTEAIQVSCNCFFYEVGRLLTIDKMNLYCRKFGFGQPTGIELNEKTGVLAGPDYRDENGLDAWSAGDTLQAAIGQSDNVCTPLQLCSYMATLINGGTRLKAHVLYQVREFYTNELIYEAKPTVLDSVEIPMNIKSTLLNAMKNVIENGSAAKVFKDYDITVGGKTGTAQVSKNRSDNAIFTAFAPFENPEIVVTSIIEQGASGTNAGFAVRDVFEYYFGNDEVPETDEN